MPTKKKNSTMDELLGKGSDLSIKQPQRGDVLEGKIVQINITGALVDVGAKCEGIIPQAEIKGLDLKVGDSVFTYVLTPEDRKRGQLILSLSKAESVKSWLDLNEAFQAGTILEAVVTGHNKGGLIVDILGLPGFVPFSHIQNAPDLSLAENELQSFLDQKNDERLKVQVIELDKAKDRIILSEKEVLLEEVRKERQQVMSKLKEGEIVTGKVTAVMPYGLMIKIKGAAEALVPIEEIGWDEEAVEETLEQYAVGTEVSAKVLEVDRELGKARLSIKEIQIDPWENLTSHYQEGDFAEAKVTKITSYGVFATLEGVEGMIALSALPKDLELSVGDTIPVAVQKMDMANKHLGFAPKSTP